MNAENMNLKEFMSKTSASIENERMLEIDAPKTIRRQTHSEESGVKMSIVSVLMCRSVKQQVKTNTCRVPAVAVSLCFLEPSKSWRPMGAISTRKTRTRRRPRRRLRKRRPRRRSLSKVEMQLQSVVNMICYD